MIIFRVTYYSYFECRTKINKIILHLGCFMNSGVQGLSIHKYRALLNTENTPFATNSASGPARRLWNYLVRQDEAQEVFIKAIFGKKMDNVNKHDEETYDNGNVILKFFLLNLISLPHFKVMAD